MRDMNLSFETKLSTPPYVLVRQVEGESVLLHLVQETYYGLDDVGTRMYLALAAADSIEQAHGQLLEEYDVDPETLRADLVRLAGNLLEQGLLQPSEE